jgi:signal transduction histidine kinase
MKAVRLLLLEDDPLDVELIVARLTEGGIDAEVIHVETAAQYQAALSSERFDLILADYSLPSFNGATALAMAREQCPHIPFVMVSGSLGEQLAIDILKGGATDYVLKQRLEHLVPSVQRALREAAERAERQRLEAELQQRAEELAERDQRKDEFLAMLAHELRNPLGAMGNAAELLRRTGPDHPAVRRALEIIERQIQHQTHLVDDLLDVSRITRGRISLQREWLDLARLVRDAVMDHVGAIEAAGLTLHPELSDEPVWVAGDRIRLAQVVGNLLTNAVKFTNSGGQITVCLVTDTERKEAAVTIRDTGIGIDPEMQRHVFESFAQADRSLDRSQGGLGLGLALVKGLIELHEGEVRVRSRGLGFGSEFTFTLPVEQKTARQERETTVPTPVRARRILVVEDNQAAAETLRDLLELSGHTVTVAFSGPAGVEAARRDQPEVVLCDIGLPGMDGYTVAQAVRSEAATAGARLIALSGYGQEEDRRRSEEAGFERHLVKPVNFEDLEELLAATPGG